MSARRQKTVTALVALLDALPGDWLEEILQRLNASGRVTLDAPAGARRRVCGICTLPYPLCRTRWGDDHEWEGPPPALESTDQEDDD